MAKQAEQAEQAQEGRIEVLPWLLGVLTVLLYLGPNRKIEDVSWFSGYLSGILFVVANAYYPARLIIKRAKPVPKPVVLFFKKYLDAHVWMNEVALFAMMVHCRYSDEGNLILYALYVVTAILTVEGLVMHYRLIPNEQKLLRMIHAQQMLFILWILLIIIGHAVT